jgi:pimeloyl-ACP methyl ester carboxylesterase
MAENLNQSFVHGATRGPVISIRQVLDRPPHDGDLGKGLLFRTNRGDIPAVLHEAPEAHLGVIWVGGARGGFGGPAKGIYPRLAEAFKDKGISSLRLNYRQPNDFPECALDLLAGIDYFKSAGYGPVALVGHSFGGAVVIAAGAVSPYVRGVVSLSPQTYGAHMAGLLSPRPLLVVHGKSDTRLPYTCGVQIYSWAKEPKQLVLYDGAEHRLEECREELETLLGEWIPATLAQTDEGRETKDRCGPLNQY